MSVTSTTHPTANHRLVMQDRGTDLQVELESRERLSEIKGGGRWCGSIVSMKGDEVFPGQRLGVADIGVRMTSQVVSLQQPRAGFIRLPILSLAPWHGKYIYCYTYINKNISLTATDMTSSNPTHPYRPRRLKFTSFSLLRIPQVAPRFLGSQVHCASI